MMKILSLGVIKGTLLTVGSVAAVTTGAILVNVNNAYKDDDAKINLVQNGIIETKNPNVLEEAENEVNESKAKLEEAKAEVEKAEYEKEDAKKEALKAEEAVTKAKDAKKLAEEEVKNAKTEKERKAALEKVKAAEKAVNTAEKSKKDADDKVQNAEKVINEAKETQKAAEEKVQKAEDNKKAVEEEIKKEQVKEEEVKPIQKEEVKQPEVKEEKKEENKTTTNTTTTTSEKAKTTSENKVEKQSTSNNTSSNTQVTNPDNENKSLTDEQLKKVLEAAARGEERDKEQYREAYYEKYGHYPDEEVHDVEFHFYSTLNPLTVRLYDHNNYYTTSRCGTTGSGCIWFAEFSCDLNACVGFPDSNGELKGNVLYSRRASIKEYTMKAPEAKYGYKFKQWEIISDRKNITVNGETGIAYKYIAVYEKTN